MCKYCEVCERELLKKDKTILLLMHKKEQNELLQIIIHVKGIHPDEHIPGDCLRFITRDATLPRRGWIDSLMTEFFD
ncbi:MAG: hypothetical protein Sylvanvirus1_67 [Sylvanvirus sp.]|uniref:Uncharacterized protein n=1 Tax=Sylvanvirus sp. TaxID=2487774 RepID=A0A3G5AJD5_9VIRU|nr:MAG: hypothetical protein Sylvanvirus1_67 [Sylvanvirus sp.]